MPVLWMMLVAAFSLCGAEEEMWMSPVLQNCSLEKPNTVPSVKGMQGVWHLAKVSKMPMLIPPSIAINIQKIVTDKVERYIFETTEAYSNDSSDCMRYRIVSTLFKVVRGKKVKAHWGSSRYAVTDTEFAQQKTYPLFVEPNSTALLYIKQYANGIHTPQHSYISVVTREHGDIQHMDQVNAIVQKICPGVAVHELWSDVRQLPDDENARRDCSRINLSPKKTQTLNKLL